MNKLMIFFASYLLLLGILLTILAFIRYASCPDWALGMGMFFMFASCFGFGEIK